jgi:DNA-binding NarL/FixJ family response regulator
VQRRIGVMIHSEDPVVRLGVVGLLGHRSDVSLVAEGDTADASVLVLCADVVDGAVLAVLRRCWRTRAVPTVLVVGRISSSGAELFGVLECGVRAIVRRQETSADRLVHAIKVADRGAGDPPPDLLGGILAPAGRAPRAGAASGELALTGLSQREIDVIGLVAEGLETREIAAKLSYSERTIKNVLQGMMLRLGLRNRPHVVAYAAREGYLRLRRGSGRRFPGSPRRGGRVPRRRRGTGHGAAHRRFAGPFRGSGVRGPGLRPS